VHLGGNSRLLSVDLVGDDAAALAAVAAAAVAVAAAAAVAVAAAAEGGGGALPGEPSLSPPPPENGHEAGLHRQYLFPAGTSNSVSAKHVKMRLRGVIGEEHDCSYSVLGHRILLFGSERSDWSKCFNSRQNPTLSLSSLSLKLLEWADWHTSGCSSSAS